MSIYAQHEDGDPQQLASNQGWGQFGDWADDLDADTYPAVVALWEHGVCEDMAALKAQLAAARAADDPGEDVGGVIDALLDAANGGDVLLITNGGGVDADSTKSVKRSESESPSYDINTPEELGLTLAEVEAGHPLLAPLLRAKTVNKPKRDE